MNAEHLQRELVPTRNLLKYKFFKKRRDFLKKQNVSEKDASDSVCMINSVPNKIQLLKLVPAKTKSFSFQVVKGRCSKAVNTKYKIKKNKAVQTAISQNQVDFSDKESEKLLQFLELVVPDMEEALCSNETIDIFYNDLNFVNKEAKQDQFELDSSDLAIIKELKSFEYESCKGKSVSCIRFRDMSTEQPALVAVSFAENLLFDESVELQMRSYQSELYLWNYEDFHRSVVLTLLLYFYFFVDDPLLHGSVQMKSNINPAD